MNRIALLLLALLALAGCASMADKSSVDDNLAQARAAVEAGNATIARGLAEKNAALMASIYAEDAVLMPPEENLVTGRVAIQKYWQRMVDAGAGNFRLETASVEASGNLAAERGMATVEIPGKDGAKQLYVAKYVVVWRRLGDGSWQIRTDIWNDPALEKDAQIQGDFEKQ